MIEAIAMHPANTSTRADALARYTANVRTWLEMRDLPGELAPAEIEIVERSWQSGKRTDQAASVIALDRQMVGIGFARSA
jgi:hypothetical protein